MKLIAIDNASNDVGLAYFEEWKLVKTEHWKIKGETQERLMRYYKLLLESFSGFEPDCIVYETPFGGGKGWAFQVLSQFTGAIVIAGKMCAVDVIEGMSPKTAKKYSTGSGNASKSEIITWAGQVYGKRASSMTEDEADAVALGHAYLTLNRK